MDHYYSEKQHTPLKLKLLTINLRGISFQLYTSSGIFSKRGLDKGTELLIESSILGGRETILDLGCGTGVVGISLKLLYPEARVIMVDINERVVMLAKKNIGINKLSGIEAVKSDLYSSINERFDIIISNPPQAAGKKVEFF